VRSVLGLWLVLPPLLFLPSCDRATGPVPEEARFAQVSAGMSHTCALAATGRAFCWGGNNFAQLGGGPDRPLVNRFRPVPVAGDLALREIRSGRLHSCALDTGGRAYCWGRNGLGQLGAGTDRGPETCAASLCASSPVAVAGGLEFAAISAGGDHTCGLSRIGEIFCWGANHAGQLGTGAAGPDAFSTTPLRARSDRAFVTVSAGERHTCALAEDGSAHCWGENSWAQAGAGTGEVCPVNNLVLPCTLTPTPTAGDLRFRAIAAGGQHTCALAIDGSTYCWGFGGSGQLGVDPDSAAQPCPFREDSRSCTLHPVRVSTELPFASITAGGSHNCGFLADGQAHCWGGHLIGQLGDCSFRKLSVVPQPVCGGHRYVRLDAGSSHTCGIATDRATYCWGRNDEGQMGSGGFTTAFGPKKVDPPVPSSGP
jgi:alpha-tubulin suppressor-like RCC1 family protein